MFTLPMSAKMLFAGFLLTTGTLFANPADPAKPASFKTSLYITKASKIRVAVEKLTTDPVTITLRSTGTNQCSVYTQTMRRKLTKLTLQLDVSELADGGYELEVKSATDQVVKPLTLTTPIAQNDVTRRIVMPLLPEDTALLSVK